MSEHHGNGWAPRPALEVARESLALSRTNSAMLAEVRAELRIVHSLLTDAVKTAALTDASLTQGRIQHDKDISEVGLHHDRDTVHLDDRLDTLEDWNKWAARVVLAAVILAVVGSIIYGQAKGIIP